MEKSFFFVCRVRDKKIIVERAFVNQANIHYSAKLKLKGRIFKSDSEKALIKKLSLKNNQRVEFTLTSMIYSAKPIWFI